MMRNSINIESKARMNDRTDYHKVVMVSDKKDIYVKGRIYSREPDRLCLYSDSKASFRGNHSIHQLYRCSLAGWKCSCGTFRRFNDGTLGSICPHVLAIEYLLASGEYVIPSIEPNSLPVAVG